MAEFDRQLDVSDETNEDFVNFTVIEKTLRRLANREVSQNHHFLPKPTKECQRYLKLDWRELHEKAVQSPMVSVPFSRPFRAYH